MIGKELTKGSKSLKLLGIIIDNKLNFNEHVTKVCDKVSRKLHILVRVATYMDTDKLRILMKAFSYLGKSEHCHISYDIYEHWQTTNINESIFISWQE